MCGKTAVTTIRLQKIDQVILVEWEKDYYLRVWNWLALNVLKVSDECRSEV